MMFITLDYCNAMLSSQSPPLPAASMCSAAYHYSRSTCQVSSTLAVHTVSSRLIINDLIKHFTIPLTHRQPLADSAVKMTN